MMLVTDVMWSVVGSCDGLQHVLHDEGEGRKAANHEEVCDGALSELNRYRVENCDNSVLDAQALN